VTVSGPWWKKVVKRFRPQIIVSMTAVVKMKGFAHFRRAELPRECSGIEMER